MKHQVEAISERRGRYWSCAAYLRGSLAGKIGMSSVCGSGLPIFDSLGVDLNAINPAQEGCFDTQTWLTISCHQLVNAHSSTEDKPLIGNQHEEHISLETTG